MNKLPLMVRLRAALKRAAYSGPMRDRWQRPDEVLAILDLEPGQRVVDLGAGGGYFTFRLARAVGQDGRVFAVDPDRDMLAWIAARSDRQGYPQIATIQPHDGELELPEPVDRILTVNAFHHLPEDRAPYFAQLADALAPGARIAIVEAQPRWFLFGHATEPETIRRTLTEAGYQVVAEHDFLPRQSLTVFER
ncbi:MAG: methyltransferase domain-containing protein [Actinobacteria bacterium]|nr:methyltransferase domain-containing protein [Actinomycetota bacterium]